MALSVQDYRSIFVDSGLMEPEAFASVEDRVKRTSESFAGAIAASTRFTDAQVGKLVADAYGVDFVDFARESIGPEAVRVIPEVVARKRGILPYEWKRGRLRVAMTDPSDAELIGFIEKKAGVVIEPGYVTPKGLERAFSAFSRNILGKLNAQIKAFNSAQRAGGKLREKDEEIVVDIADLIMRYGYENDASDIHIEPHRKESVLRFRIDGILHDLTTLPKGLHEKIVSRIKILSNLRTDEHFAAQDGKFAFTPAQRRVDARVSIVPVVGGEKVVMRILSEKGQVLNLDTLGLEGEDLEKVRRAAELPYGVILATGPTGSGKTSTMYAVLKLLNDRGVNIQTIEDPVEYDISGINQIQVNPRTNLTFAAGLRSIVRQDPDIVMVGEIRDPETAQIAVNAAMTGHLVLSTLHTNDAPTALPRLRNMEVPPFLIASSVSVIIAQRLVRRICRKCIASAQTDSGSFKGSLPPEIYEEYFGKKRKVRVYEGKGCPTCAKTGYEGRTGIFEVLEVTERIRELIARDADADTIRDAAREEGMTTLLEDGIRKMLEGVTTLEEVLRVAV